MKRIYDTGKDANSIKLSMKIGTAVTAYTSVYLVRSGGQQTKLTESDLNSGDIAEYKIGTAREIRNSYLIIITSLNLSSIDKKNWQQVIENIVTRYYINGGFSGDQVYNHDTDDILEMPGGNIIISKPIELQ